MILPGLNQRGGKRDAEGKRQFTGAQLEKQQQKSIRLIRRSLQDAGYPPELCAQAAIQVSGAGFLPGLSLASQYAIRERLQKYPRMHVQIHWRDNAGKSIKVPGPICLGRGRFFGLGLFVAIPE